MHSRSIIFKNSAINLKRFGQVLRRKINSNVNQTMQITSIAFNASTIPNEC